MEQIRSFIAIELPEEVKAELSSLEERLKSAQQPFVKWVDPAGIHLTLKFLGNVAAKKIPDIVEALTKAVQGFAPFSLGVGSLGAFPSWQQPRVVWVGVRGEIEKLNQLQKRVDIILRPLGFPTESRPFSAHLTLARLRESASPRERRELGNSLAAIEFEPSVSFRVEAVSLMRSQLTPSGAIYSRLAVARLGMLE
jgi:2'-5' RNA ligase